MLNRIFLSPIVVISVLLQGGALLGMNTPNETHEEQQQIESGVNLVTPPPIARSPNYLRLNRQPIVQITWEPVQQPVVPMHHHPATLLPPPLPRVLLEAYQQRAYTMAPLPPQQALLATPPGLSLPPPHHQPSSSSLNLLIQAALDNKQDQ